MLLLEIKSHGIAVHIFRSNECHAATNKWVEDHLTLMAEKFDHLCGKGNRERCWMEGLVAYVASLIKKFPDAELGLEPFLRCHTIDVCRRALARALGPDFEILLSRRGCHRALPYHIEARSAISSYRAAES